MTPDQIETQLDDLRDEVSAIEDDLRDGGDPVVAQRNLRAARIGFLSVERAAFSVGDKRLQGDAREALSGVDRLIDRAARLAALPPPPPPLPPVPPAPPSRPPARVNWVGASLVAGVAVLVISLVVGMQSAGRSAAGTSFSGVLFLVGLVVAVGSLVVGIVRALVIRR